MMPTLGGWIGGFGRLKGGEEGLDRDSPAGNELRAAPAEGSGERRRPHVLIHQDAGGAPGLDDRRCLADVVFSEQTRCRTLENGQVERPITVEVADLERLNRAVALTLDEYEIEDPD